MEFLSIKESGMKLRDRIFLWRNDYCPHHFEPIKGCGRRCDLCREEEAVEEALGLEQVKRRVMAIEGKA